MDLEIKEAESRPVSFFARVRMRLGRRPSPGAIGLERPSRFELFPVRQHLRGFGKVSLLCDLRAGVNVALLDFPQGMAYALIAGLPFSMGIYASAVAAFLGPLFASSRFIMLGPTNAIAVLTLSTFLSLGFSQEEAVVAMPLLLLMVASLMILGGFLGVAGMIRFVSRTVITGYITAAACLIVVKQLRHVTGVETETSTTFFDSLVNVVGRLPESDMAALTVAGGTLGVYFLCRRFLRGWPHVAIVLAIMYGVAEYLRSRGWEIAPLSEHALPVGHWPVTLPTVSFALIGQLAPAAVALAFLSLLESSSIAKTLAARAGDPININQQMFSMGAANAGCAFLGGMPISGSLTRSALNFESGARTPLSSIVSALSLATGILVLGPHMAAIPMPALSALVILVGLSLFNRRNIKLALGTTFSDAAVFCVTFGSGLLFSLDTAIYFGVGVSLFLFLRKAAAPVLTRFALSETGREISGEGMKPALALLHLDGNFFFGSSDLFLDEMRRLLRDPSLKFVILRLRNALHLDASAAMALHEVHRLMSEKGIQLLLASVQPEAEGVLRDSGLIREIGGQNVFREDPENPTRSTSLALKRARALAGEKEGRELEVKLFVSEEKKES